MYIYIYIFIYIYIYNLIKPDVSRTIEKRGAYTKLFSLHIYAYIIEPVEIRYPRLTLIYLYTYICIDIDIYRYI